VQEVALVVDKQLLEATPRAHLSIGNDIMSRMTLPHTIEVATSKGTRALHTSPTASQHLVDGPNSLQVVVSRLAMDDTRVVIPEVIEVRAAHVVAFPTTSFCLDLVLRGSS